MQQIRTDLAMESAEEMGSMPGVKVSHWENGGVEVTEVEVTDLKSATRLGKPMGRYVTLEAPALKDRDIDARLAMSSVIGEEIARMLGDTQGATVLVAGLGNRQVTPDSLGPGAIDRLLVTRHIFTELPAYADERLRSVCAVAPGVMGVTGIETAEMLESIVRTVEPKCVICVDALSARAPSRIGSAVQISNTGIQPGSGVGNRRAALNKESLGVDVIAVGMPTVIYAATLARDALASAGSDAVSDFEQKLADIPGGDLIVTPREIDALIKDSAGMIAMGINRALQPEMSDEEIMAIMD